MMLYVATVVMNMVLLSTALNALQKYVIALMSTTNQTTAKTVLVIVHMQMLNIVPVTF